MPSLLAAVALVFLAVALAIIPVAAVLAVC